MKKILYIIGLIAVATACVREIPNETPAPRNVETTITVRVPEKGFDLAPTRALTPDDEHRVATIDVLVFRQSGASKLFYEHKQGVLIDGTSASKSFKLSVTPSADPLQFVVFANSRAIISSLSLNNTMSRDDVLKLVEMTRTTAWNSTTGTYDPLPMWGETAFRVVTDAASASATVDLLRSLAKVDVNVATTAQAKFTMTDVWLYNSSTVGRIAPLDASWNSTTKRVTATSAPDGGWTANTTPLAYTVTDGKSLVRSIYAFEAPAATSNTSVSAPCLVIGGSYDGGAKSYYRVDFYNQSTDAFLPLMRNFMYDVQITKVEGNGYPTAAEAIAAGFSKLTATTHQWNEGHIGNVVWDGRDMLAVGETEFSLYPEAQNIDIDIATNYSQGWKATLDNPSNGWLSISGATGTGAGDGNRHTLRLELLQNTIANRTETVTITAGRLKQTITINQRIDKLLSIEIGDMEMIYSAATPIDAQLRVEWEPAAKNCKVELLPVSGYAAVEFTGANTLPTHISDQDGNAVNGGARNFVFKPDAATLNMFEERRSIMRFTASNTDDSQTQFRDVLIRQLDYAIEITGIPAGDLYQLGTSYEFNVKANAPWKVEVPIGGVIASSLPVIGEPNITTGETFTFKTGSTLNTLANLTFTSKDNGLFTQTVAVTLEKNYPNCYIVNPAPGVNFVDIPIRKAFNVWLNDPDLVVDLDTVAGTWGAELIWQDSTDLISSSTPPTLYGNDHNAYIRVMTNNTGIVGNAVVAFTIGSGEDRIKWSWHVWVTDYNPNLPANQKTNSYNQVVFMDRNLGATDITPGSGRSMGVLYQHGRKDPFPSGAKTTSNTPRPIYNLANTALTEGIAASVTGVRRVATVDSINLVNSIQRPLYIYTGNTWFSKNIQYHRSTLWYPGDKTEYDPCPEGWRISNISLLEKAVPTSYVAMEGVYFDEIGFFPLSGRRTNGVLGLIGTDSEIWLANTSQYTTMANISASMRLTPGMTLERATGNPSLSGSVRCTKVK